MALWGGRFSGGASGTFKAFNDSLPFDYVLVKQDIQGSKAWANALHDAGILTDQEIVDLQEALDDINSKLSDDYTEIVDSGAEDIHSWVEQQLIQRIGDLGKKLHTGRSRNDQVSTDLRLWTKTQVVELLDAINNLREELMNLAEKHVDTIWPGYTHLQRAQPITFAHWCLAYVEMLTRDSRRLNDALVGMDFCPLGSGALAGTAYPINREKLAYALGFSDICLNSLDAVSDRDFVLDVLHSASVGMMHLSRMAEDLIFYNSGESGFVEMSDDVTSGSSLMPQKKNPDAMELVRGKTGRVYGAQQGLLATLKGLPLAYNKDLQEDKEGLFDAVITWHASINICVEVIESLKVNEEVAREAAALGFANATELADYLVGKGMPFRDAHHVSGSVVLLAIDRGCAIEGLSLEELREYSELIDGDVYEHLSLDSCLQKRKVKGGTAPSLVKQALINSRIDLQKMRTIVRPATLADLTKIKKIVGYWANQGENLPRSDEDLIHSIGDFAVTEVEGVVTGCASLYVYSTGLAEIRSLGIDDDYQGKGHGQQVVRFLLARAKQLKLSKVFVLTRVPDFFSRLGFDPSDKDDLPEKVMKDCELCPRQDNCDEDALTYELSQHSFVTRKANGRLIEVSMIE